ncbi:MAG: glycosyltransferase family 2 protein [Leptolyngbya sp. BL-A-14]
MPKVSVVIPAYNAMQYLEATLESVLKQTFTDFEVLIINDGSKDHIVEWFSQIKDNRVKLISQHNQGLSRARNTGITNAQGEYIAFLDADDLWEPSKLEKQVQYLDSHADVGMVSTKVVEIDEKGEVLAEVKVPETEKISLEDLLLSNPILCGSTPLVRHECFDKVGVFDPSLSSAADWDMWIRIALRYSVSAVTEALVKYRRHSTSMSRDCTKMAFDVERIVEKGRSLIPFYQHSLLRKAYSAFALQATWEKLDESHYREAFFFSKKAFRNSPGILFYWPFVHANLIIVSKSILPASFYKTLLKVLHMVKVKSVAS